MIIFFSLQICHLKRGNWCLNLQRRVIKWVQTTLHVLCSPCRNEARLSALTWGQEDSKDEEKKTWHEDATSGCRQRGDCSFFSLPRWDETHQELGSSRTRAGTWSGNAGVSAGSKPSSQFRKGLQQTRDPMNSMRTNYMGNIRHVWVCCWIRS